MKVKFIITCGDSCEERIVTFDRTQPLYQLADQAYLFALDYLQKHPNITFDDLDYDWEEQE